MQCCRDHPVLQRLISKVATPGSSANRKLSQHLVPVVRKNSVRAGFRVDVTLLHRNRVLVFDFLRSTPGSATPDHEPRAILVPQ